MIRILAQTIDRQLYLRSMHKQFSTADPNLWREILLGVTIVGGVIALAWAVWFWQRWRRERGEIKPLTLYRHVLARIGLSAGEGWRLRRLAKAIRLPHPTALLISVELYDEAVQRYCAGKGWLGSRKSAAAQFAAIRTRLFGG